MLRIIAAALFALLSITSAEAASRVWISEFGAMTATASGGSAGQMAPLPALALQSTLDLSGGTAQTSAAFGSQTRYIRVICEVQCAIRGDGSAATAMVAQQCTCRHTPGRLPDISTGNLDVDLKARYR
ncbi:MAG TPA: hypothetical protein VGE93_16050 [Bryobacteraceae bacterium]